MNVPEHVAHLLDRLRGEGFEAYAVGGCVRDSLLGIEPHDWDICTSAKPEEILRVFHALRVITTGIQHGTVTVLLDGTPYEITTFRTDGDYTDHRHPDAVAFVPDLREDLARRDFTVNAMAFAPATGLEDPFGGREDLERRLIRCVGDPRERFGEDALRILRALRFASVYDFEIDPETDAALRLKAPDLRLVAGERLREELLKLLCGQAAGRILRAYPEVLGEFLPDLRPMFGYDQHNHHHIYDLWEHTVRGVEGVPPQAELRLVMLLHDTGKPAVRTFDEKGEAHYLGHQQVSAEIAERAADTLRLSRRFRERLVLLVRNHDIPLRGADGEVNTDRAFLLRRLRKFGEEDLRALFFIHRADRIATGYSSVEREDARLRERVAALDALTADQPCFTLKDLAVNGHDLAACGLGGKAIGDALERLLEAVISGEVPNEKEALLRLLDA